MPRRLLQRSQHLLILLGVLPVALATTAYLTSARHLESVRNTEDADTFLRQLDGLLASVSDAETGQRGYLLTGVQQYLSPYKRGRATVQQRLTEVIQTGRKRATSAEELERLQLLVHEKIDELDNTVALYARGDRNAAMALVETGRGHSLMTELRLLLTRI